MYLRGQDLRPKISGYRQKSYDEGSAVKTKIAPRRRATKVSVFVAPLRGANIMFGV